MNDTQMKDAQNQLLLLSRWLTLSGYFGLMILIYSWHLFLQPLEKHQISIMLILQLGPLMMPLRGILHGRTYTHAWSMYLALGYFIVGVWYASNNATMAFGLSIVFLSLCFFTGALLYTRYSSRSSWH